MQNFFSIKALDTALITKDSNGALRCDIRALVHFRTAQQRPSEIPQIWGVSVLPMHFYICWRVGPMSCR